jgi:hypothetical protein
MKIIRDRLLQVNLDDLGMRVVEGDLHVPPEVARLFDMIGVRDATYVVPMMEQMPTFFLSELGVDREQFVEIRENLRNRIGLPEKPQQQEFQMPPLGALPKK